MNRSQLVSQYLDLQQQLIEAYTASPSERKSIQHLTEYLAATLCEIRRLRSDEGRRNGTTAPGMLAE